MTLDPALLRRLFDRRRRGIELGLERTKDALARHGLDKPKWGAAVLVGGTNGKGSTTAFLESVARSAGLRTGRFSSPHLCRLAERFELGGVPIPDAELLEELRYLDAAEPDLTFFEFTTVLAARKFSQHRVDLAIFEVGLGGRLDSSNALVRDLDCVTGVAMDHSEYLGDSLADIAREKAGIFREGYPAVIGRSGLEPGVAMLTEGARAVGAAPVHIVGPAELDEVPAELGMVGAHQRQNAAAAVAITKHLGAPLVAHTAAGLARAKLPARLERVSPNTLIDGAHNPHAARALADHLREQGPAVLILGVSEGKDIAGIVEPLLEVVDEVHCVAAAHPRAYGAEALAALVRRLGGQARVANGLASALAATEACELRVVTGSLFVAGEARALLSGARCDPHVV